MSRFISTRPVHHTLLVVFSLFAIALLNTVSVPAQDINELYVVNGWGAETLDKIDLITGTVTHDVAVLGLYPNRIFVNDTMAVVVNSGDANLQLIRLADYSTIGYVDFDENDNPSELAVINDNIAYVSLFMSNEVAYCDLTSRTVVSRVAVGHRPEGVLVHGPRLYVVHTAFSDVEYKYEQGTVYVIDRSTFAVTDSVYVSTNPQSLVAVADGTIHILCTGNYKAEGDPERIEGRVDILDPATLTVIDHIDIGGFPGVIHVDRRDNAYLTDYGDWMGPGYVYKYNALSREVINGTANPIMPGYSPQFVTGDMSNNLYVLQYDHDDVVEYDMNDELTGRVFGVGSGPTAAALRTNRLPGDIDENDAVNPVDVVYLVNHVYKGYSLPGPRASVADVNRDCQVNPVDVVYLVNSVYHGWGGLLWGCIP